MPTAASVPSSRARCFDTELKQERDQHHRRGDQEETEAQETELRRAWCQPRPRDPVPLRAEASSRATTGRSLARIPLAIFVARAAPSLRWNSQQTDRPPPAGPQSLRRRQRNKRLRRRAILVPIVFILRPDFFDQLKRQIPIADRFLIGHARQLRRELRIGGRRRICRRPFSIRRSLSI